MKNRSVTLLALLAANDHFGQPNIHRTALVKQAFLAETIRPLYRLWRHTFTFIRYRYGPYSEDIFHRLDTLIFNGLVEVVSAERRRGRLEAKYRITAAGHHILKQIGADEIAALSSDLVWALQAIGVEQVSAISRVVYQEAEFARVFAQHLEAGIGPESKVPLPSIDSANNQTFITLATLRGIQQWHSKIERDKNVFILSSREVVRVFLENLTRQIPRFTSNKRVA